ncbi:MAG: protein-L-isoaspartate(D-aspartate) O-methyltransferase [Anaeromyxobacter sp.]|nr:protein-L-isoaspartate(D-aspartate) O-methyltransferase [Anaeromyxobacter sp.]MBL0274666.1 protein-L-isoaspartate(D-aspartate) O-methyltransferase [Anaeromyxobacter sp.]
MDDGLAARLRAEGIRDERVIASMARLDRSRFIPDRWRAEAGRDAPVPIGEGQTISQPTLVGLMTAALRLSGDERVLEIGTGSGYQAAVLSPLCAEVYSVERLPGLAAQARAVLLDELGVTNVHLRTGDGALGWPEEAPFDRILVTAAAPEVPQPLLDQLAPGGRLLAPVGTQGGPQWLRLVRFDWDGSLHSSDLLQVRFVPLV